MQEFSLCKTSSNSADIPSQQGLHISVYTYYKSFQLGIKRKKMGNGVGNTKGKLKRWQSRATSLGKDKGRRIIRAGGQCGRGWRPLGSVHRRLKAQVLGRTW